MSGKRDDIIEITVCAVCYERFPCSKRCTISVVNPRFAGIISDDGYFAYPDTFAIFQDGRKKP